MNKKGQKLKLSRSLIILVLFSLPLFQTYGRQDDDSTTKIIVRNNTRTIKKTNGVSSFNIEYRGDIEVTDDDKDVKSISRGGYLEISKTTFGSKRRLLIENSGNGLKRTYYEGRSKTDWEPEGRKWLADILPEIVRSSGIAAKSRVDRYYKKGGINAVTDEIARLDGSYVKAIYGKHLLAKNLNTNELKTALNALSDEIDSDYYLAEILKDNADKLLKNETTTDLYIDAVENIGSDYYAAVALKEVLKKQTPSSGNLEKVMKASSKISSDYYQATLLSDVLEIRELEGKVLAQVVEASRAINSDYYQSQILSKALKKDNLPRESFKVLIESIADVGSDYYMATVFSDLTENELDAELTHELIKLVNDKMHSDYYASAVLSKILQKQMLNEESIEEITEAIQHIGSGHYAASTIKDASRNELSEKNLMAMIKAAASISSDYYASQALEALAPQVKNSNNKVKDAYREAAKNIRSDTYYGKAIRAID